MSAQRKFTKLGKSMFWREPEQRVIKAKVCRKLEPSEDLACDVKRTVEVGMDGSAPVVRLDFGLLICVFVFFATSEK